MAKNGKYLTVGAIITILVLIAGIVSSYTLNDAKTNYNEQAIGELKKEGCIPARENDKDIGVLLERTLEFKRVQISQGKKLDEILKYLRDAP